MTPDGQSSHIRQGRVGPGPRRGAGRARSSRRARVYQQRHPGRGRRASSGATGSVLFVLRDAVDGIVGVLARLVGELILHEEGVLAAVLVVGPQNADRAEALGAEEQLR